MNEQRNGLFRDDHFDRHLRLLDFFNFSKVLVALMHSGRRSQKIKEKRSEAY